MLQKIKSVGSIDGTQLGATSVSNSVLGDVSVVMVSPLDYIFIIKLTID
ncbi:MAG: hypothetical protein MGF17_16205 [Trichodesmium sp. MAG_R04]|nr:hypothetical protein [Trichodesmium sp. MAG_R04]